MVDRKLSLEFDDFVTTYVDDILITSNNCEEHAKHVDKVLTSLREWGVTVKLSNFQFIKQKVNFVGYLIAREGISHDPDKIQNNV